MMSVKSKNIHVLPTDKPSKIYLNTGEWFFENDYSLSVDECINQHIYITSDEEIKEDYVIAYGVIIKVMIFDEETLYFVNGTKAKREDCKKIILTTDQDLIKDGVQSIDDEFLEWFVNNPSCESVKIEDFPMTEKYNSKGEYIHRSYWGYKIITPKEEPKQETLEEVAERLFPINTGDESLDYQNKVRKPNWISGAKWQQERMYSEEEARIIWRAGQEYCKTSGGSITFEQLTEKLKTKYPVKTKDKIISETLEETKQKARDYGNSLVEGTFENTNIIDDWLEKNGDPEIHKQVEQEAKELCEQNKISEEELERVISAPINLYSVIKYLFNKFKKIRYVR